MTIRIFPYSAWRCGGLSAAGATGAVAGEASDRQALAKLKRSLAPNPCAVERSPSHDEEMQNG
jgi:hypothetical protein